MFTNPKLWQTGQTTHQQTPCTTCGVMVDTRDMIHHGVLGRPDLTRSYCSHDCEPT